MQPDAERHLVVSPADIDPGQRDALRRFRSWRRFHNGPRSSPQPLLAYLARYANAVLVAGCQRSGTTMLTRVIAGAHGFRRLALTHDDELDAALALCGQIDLPDGHRYCLQTTYLNERVSEYGMLGEGQRLIWMLRNPYSVVYSMTYNWKRFALNELFDGCGKELATSARVRRTRLAWPMGPSLIEKACLSYSSKTTQIETICSLIPRNQVMVVDYDALVAAPEQSLRAIFAFIGEPYLDAYTASVRGGSSRKADRLSAGERAFVRNLAEPAYLRCLAHVSAISEFGQTG